MATRVVVFAAPRHKAFPVPSRDTILVADAPYRRRTYSGGEVRCGSLGVVHLAVPWDAQTFVGVAIGALAGIGAGLTPALATAVGALGEATGSEVIGDITIPARMRRSLATKGAFVVPQLGIVEAAITDGRMTRQLHIVEEADDGRQHEHVANIDYDNIPLGEAAEAVAVQRGFAEGVAALKLAANTLLGEAGVGMGRLDPALPFSSTMTRLLDGAGIEMSTVSALARERYEGLAADFAGCPPAYETYLSMLG